MLGASAAELPTVSGVKEFSQTKPILLDGNAKKGPTLHKN